MNNFDFLTMKHSLLFPLVLILIWTRPASSQPQPEDLFREYIWLPTMVKESEKFLRVGGRLDYKSSEAHMPQGFHKEGRLLIEENFDLEQAIRAEVVLELVQSHEDTKGLEIQINQQEWISVPDMSELPKPQADYMLHTYPIVNIPLNYLKSGEGNTFKLRVDSTQRWNWPQNIFYGFTFRIYYDKKQKSHVKFTLNNLKKGQKLSEQQPLSINTKKKTNIQQVDYVAYYDDFNWEGDGVYRQWHGHPHQGALRNHIGSTKTLPYEYIWDTSWLPDQSGEVKIAARVEDQTGLIYITPAVEELKLVRNYSVELCRPYHQPANWVSREDTFSAKFAIHGDLTEAEAYQIAWRSWSPCYARGVFINGHHLIDREGECYVYAEHLRSFENTDILLPGENVITTGKTPLIDGKMVHGMEVQFPGIMVKVKYKTAPSINLSMMEGKYENRPHFIVKTPSAIYYYDQAGGGLSRMLDLAGRDWIDFKMNPWGEYPAAAASAFRGIPNFVFGSDDGGAGHPGHDQCISGKIGENAILTTSKSGKWQWKWTFFETYAKVEMLKVDPAYAYWFLYEGKPGGKFDPPNQYFGTNLSGPHNEQLDYYKGNKRFEQWQWAYFGHQDVDQVMFIAQEIPDEHSDTFSYLGNTKSGINAPDGMVVFGFGRASGAKPLMRTPNTFYVGFIQGKIKNKKNHKEIGRIIGNIF